MTRKIILKIEGMECPNCAMILEMIEDKLPGIERAEASYHKGQLVVDYNEAQVSEEKIKEAVQQLGYAIGS